MWVWLIIFGVVIGLLIVRKMAGKTNSTDLPKSEEPKPERKESEGEKILSVSYAQSTTLMKILESSLDWRRDFHTNEVIFSRPHEYRDGHHNQYDENWFDREDSEIKFYPSENIIILTKKLARDYHDLPKDIFQISPVEYSVLRKWCNLRPEYERTHLLGITPNRSDLHFLTAEQLHDVRYYALRQWRADKSEKKQIFVEDIFTDRVLGLLVEHMPSTLEDLSKITHVKTDKWDKYGEKVLKIINQLS